MGKKSSFQHSFFDNDANYYSPSAISTGRQMAHNFGSAVRNDFDKNRGRYTNAAGAIGGALIGAAKYETERLIKDVPKKKE